MLEIWNNNIYTHYSHAYLYIKFELMRVGSVKNVMLNHSSPRTLIIQSIGRETFYATMKMLIKTKSLDCMAKIMQLSVK